MAVKVVRRRYGPKPLATAVERGQNAVDDLVLGLGAEVAAAVRAVGDRPLEAGDWAPIMVAVDRALAKVYGPRQGADSALARTLEAETRRTTQAVASAAVAGLEPVLEAKAPTLLRAIRSGAGVKRE
jgi:hypothetical protein